MRYRAFISSMPGNYGAAGTVAHVNAFVQFFYGTAQKMLTADKRADCCRAARR